MNENVLSLKVQLLERLKNSFLLNENRLASERRTLENTHICIRAVVRH